MIREIAGYMVDTKNSLVLNGTKPVSERHFYGSKTPKKLSCYDAEKNLYINTEYFSPVIYDREQGVPAYSKSWEVYIGTGKSAKLVRIDYPESYKRWWYEQERRCKEGYTIGGVYITGAHYWYLNFWRIKAKKRGKGYINPRFLDLDKEFFDLVDQARAEGKNLLILKRRQIGFSEKLAALAALEYTFFPASHSVIVAGLEEYASNTMNKTRTGLDALHSKEDDAGREFFKRRKAGENSDNSDRIMAGWKIGEVTVGFKSIVEAITVKDNPQAVNGKSPTLAIMEESGINAFLKATYNMMLPAMKEQGLLDGRIVIFVGTGGDMGKGIDQFMELFYDPENSELLAVENVWEEEEQGRLCCPFFPAWKYYIMDNDGNSYKEPSLICIQEERDRKKNKPKDLHDLKTQFPLTPREAFAVGELSFFNAIKLENQRRALISGGYQKKEQWGRLEWLYDETDKSRVIGTEWIPVPADGTRWDLDEEGDLKYPVLIMEHPITIEKKPIEQQFQRLFKEERIYHLYGAGTDSYDKDQANSSDSLGACAIFKGYYSSGELDNHFPCRILWRPARKEKFFEMTARMCCHYHNCLNLIELSNITIFDWYKNNGFEFLLKERPLISYATVKESLVHDKYGVHPATKYAWEDNFQSYIEQYSDHIIDYEACCKLLKYRRTFAGKKYNCDLTIAMMLAHENMRDVRNHGYTARIIENKKSKPLFGYYKVGGTIKRV